VLMDIEDLQKDFKKITGDDVSPQTLRRWADEGLIANHRDNPHKIAKTGRGNAEDWPPEALEEAVAVWAVNKVNGKRLPPKTIREIRTVAQQVFRTPQAQYEWSRDVILSGPKPSDNPGYRELKMKFHEDWLDLTFRLRMLRELTRHYSVDELKLKFSHWADERLLALLDDEEIVSNLDRFMEGHRETDDVVKIWLALDLVMIKSPRVFELARTWVAAFVKAQKGESLSQPKKVVFHWSSLGDSFLLDMITLEKPDPIVSFFSDAFYGDDDEDYVDIPDDERRDEDEIVIFIDGVDVRKKVFYAPFEEYEEGRSPQREP
jgi:hypothetical protein